MAIGIEIYKLIPPLGDDSQRIFEEGDHDEKPPYGRKIATMPHN